MVSSFPNRNRRSLILSAMAVAGIPVMKGASQTPTSTVTMIDPAMLEPATEPADWDVQKDYSTATVPAPEPTEYCDLKLFPHIPESSVAYSGLLQAEDLNRAPNMVLIQEFQFTDTDTANLNLSIVIDEVVALATEKYFLPGTDAFSTILQTENEFMVTHEAPNGARYALLVLAQDNRILVLRAGAKGADPAGFLPDLVTGIVNSTPATPVGGEGANVETDWEVEGWRWNYGPIDIHPDRYQSPVCPAN